jgi:hypothetical protein
MAMKRLRHITRSSVPWCGVLVLVFTLFLGPGTASVVQAANIDVPCDAAALVAAIEAANGNGEADTLNLEAGCTYGLTEVNNNADGPNGLPSITSEIVINGNGATIERSDTSPEFRIFHVAAEGNLTLNELTVRNGVASGGGLGSNGGGISNWGTTSLHNSTVRDNHCIWGGGGVANAGTLELANSTITHNSAGDLGGGIANATGGVVDLINSTVTQNSAGSGGGLWIVNVVGMVNTIVADQLLGTDCAGPDTISSNGHNLDTDRSCNLTESTDLPGADPLLGLLQDNGGPTETHALPPDSPAVDQGSCGGFTTDQRGRPRPVDILNIGNADDGCDIGAFEYQPGKIVVNNDEWPLSDEGFPPNQDTDAAQFARNVASWFTGGEPGDFLVYSTPFALNTGLTGAQLESTMTTAGHTWTVISTTPPIPFSLFDLLQYDGIFLAGSQADNFANPPPVVPPGFPDLQVLIDYVKAGGNVYLAGGTDPDLPQQEAEQWNPFLHACGLDFAERDEQNGLGGMLRLVGPSSHPIFDGVRRLYQRNGSFVRDWNSLDPSGVVLVHSEEGIGLYGVCTIGAAIESAPTAIDLLSFTAHPATDHVTLAWQTGTEVDNAGFNLWRAMAADGPYTKLNDALIPAEGDPVSGANYVYIDSDVVEKVTYYYKLEDVDIRGVTTLHGPVSARVQPRFRRLPYRPTLPGF